MKTLHTAQKGLTLKKNGYTTRNLTRILARPRLKGSEGGGHGGRVLDSLRDVS